MFKRQNFCHVASNNRNQVKVGVFVYRTTDDLETVSANGYFNDSIIDINLHDLIIHEKVDTSDATKVQRNVLCVTERTLENVGTVVIKSQWQVDVEEDIADLQHYVDETFVRKDGTSVMTGPLKFRAGSFVGAVAGGLGDGISIYKLKDDNTIDSEVASLTKENGFTPGTTNAQDIGSSSLKWKDAYIARVITAVLNNGGNIAIPNDTGTMALTKNIKDGTLTITQGGQTKGTFTANQDTNTTIDIDAVNTDLSNLSSVGKNIANWSSNVSNCITEIPQDIKLELSNGTLTLKAGSKVYVPNGAGVFNVVTITADVSATRTDNQKCMIYYTPASNTLSVFPLVLCFSGSTAPSGYQFMYWYDTTENKCKFTSDSGTTWYEGRTLPLGIVSTDGTKISAIDQVFNGFGYVGSTVFILPNTKGLVPNGRNTDGTFKTTSMTTSSVITRTGMGTNVSNYQAGLNTGYFINYSSNYTLGDDGFLHIPNGTVYNDVVFATYSTGADGRITAFSSKSAFRAVDYNEALLISTPQTIKSLKTLSRADIGQDEILKITTPNTGVKSEINYYDASTQNKIATQFFQKSGTEYHFAMAGWDPALNVVSDGIWLVGKQVGANWTWHVEAPTPALSDDSSKIATTEWVRDLFGGGFGMPDYSSLVANISNPYTPTVNGYIIARRTGAYGNIWVKNNTHDVQIAGISCTDSESSTQIVMVIANKGEEYSFSPSNATAKFVPCKGA